MRIKYFLRGLGMGILFTAFVLAISYHYKMTDEMVLLRAEELGMVFKEESPTASPSKVESEEPVITPTMEPTLAPSTEPTIQPTLEPTSKPKPTKEPELNDEKPEVTVTIKRGMWSNQISKKLEEAGVVKNADDFDRYLVDKKVASKIKVGVYSIPQNAEYSEIVDIITK